MVALLLGVSFRGDAVEPVAVVGVALIIVGAFFASRKESRSGTQSSAVHGSSGSEIDAVDVMQANLDIIKVIAFTRLGSQVPEVRNACTCSFTCTPNCKLEAGTVILSFITWIQLSFFHYSPTR